MGTKARRGIVRGEALLVIHERLEGGGKRRLHVPAGPVEKEGGKRRGSANPKGVNN